MPDNGLAGEQVRSRGEKTAHRSRRDQAMAKIPI